MGNIVLFWISINFLYGLFLWIVSCFKKSYADNAIDFIDTPLSKFILICFGFFFAPFIVQYFLYHFFMKMTITINQTLLTAFISELVLFVFVLKIVVPRIKPMEGFNISMRAFKDIYEGYCKILPVVALITIFWEYVLKFLASVGFKITIDLQPIVQLLLKSNINFVTATTLFIAVVVLAPICEEIFFRGFLFRCIYKNFSLNNSLWISSSIFACAHQHLATFLPLMFLGYLLGFSYAKTGNIFVNIGIHALFNGTNYILIFLFKTYDF